jgi:ABC-type proline/glycine betaine transport system permease subunit
MKYFGKSFAFTLCLALFAFLPLVAGAQTVQNLTDKTTEIVNGSVIGLVFTLGFLYFFWGVVQYVINPEEEKKAKGKQMIINGLLALTVMFAVYSLITIIRNTFSLTSNVPEKIPKLPK